MEVKEVDILPYVTWKEGHFLFKNQSLEKIMDIMARWYDVSVEFQDESIRNLHFTGDIKRHANFSIILKALTSSVNVKLQIGRSRIDIIYEINKRKVREHLPLLHSSYATGIANRREFIN